MKIRHRLMILVGLPIVCQAITVGLLSMSQARVDQLVLQEAKAKRVVSATRDINAGLDRMVLVFTGAGLVGQGSKAGVKHQMKDLEKDFAQLSDLVKDNPEASNAVADLKFSSYKFVENIAELARSYKPGESKLFLSQFIGQEEFFESLQIRYEAVSNSVEKLMDIYQPLASDFQPQALKARADLRLTLLFAVVFNVLLVVYLALSVSRTTVARLGQLMKNLKAFTVGEPVIARLSGDDELTDLDKAFAEMADERQRFEEMKKSIRAMVNHDLRSPLTSMGLRLELLLERGQGSLPPEVLSELKTMNSEVHRLSRLAKTLLDIEKIEDGKIEMAPENVSCLDLVDTALGAIEMQAKWKKISISIDVPNQIICRCDRDRTIQVLVNLLSNAIKFTPSKSNISVAVSAVDNERIRFKVTDEGPGVPADQVSRLFSKFAQLEQSPETRQQGSGLGLYICKMLLSAQNGSIGYTAGETGGSAFWFELPMAEQCVAAI